MPTQNFLAAVLGIPHIPSIRQINIRSGPSTAAELIFKADVGLSNLQVLEVKPDAQGQMQGAKVYQWFQLRFADGRMGWARDDLITIQGDGTRFGYPVLQQMTPAFTVPRQVVSAVGVRNEPTPQPQPEPVIAAPMSPQPGKGEPGVATCMGRGGANMRSGPGTNYPILGRMQFMSSGKIVEVKPGEDGTPLKWERLETPDLTGWVREDFLRLSGNFERFGLGFLDQYPSPVPISHWIRDYDPAGAWMARHDGWDQAGDTGAPIYAGPKGGFVVQQAVCANCGTQGFSVVDKGLQVGSAAALMPGWNFGYGHYVIVRYSNDLLPNSTRRRLSEIGRDGQHLFVIYAHLHSMDVLTGQTLQPNQRVGTMGNSGNSSGTHLHLEVRAGSDAAETRWAMLRSGLLNPSILFLR